MCNVRGSLLVSTPGFELAVLSAARVITPAQHTREYRAVTHDCAGVRRSAHVREWWRGRCGCSSTWPVPSTSLEPASPGRAESEVRVRGPEVHDLLGRREAVYIQTTPMGDVVVVYWEADDVEAALKGMATSDDPFDQWFRDHVRDVHGINVEDGFPPPEQVMDFRTS